MSNEAPTNQQAKQPNGAEDGATEKPHLWKPGQSGNPGGRPKQVRELLELARTSVPKAFALAKELMADPGEDSRVRLEAAKFLTSYGIGAPPREQLDVTGAIHVNIVIPATGEP